MSTRNGAVADSWKQVSILTKVETENRIYARKNRFGELRENKEKW